MEHERHQPGSVSLEPAIALRYRLGITQYEVADAMETNRSSLCQFETRLIVRQSTYLRYVTALRSIIENKRDAYIDGMTQVSTLACD